MKSPPVQFGGLFLFVLHPCQKKQISSPAGTIAEDTLPPLSFRKAVIQRRFFPETDVCLMLIESCQEPVPALRIGPAIRWAREECGHAPANFL
jgi:hypothetical protein